MKVVLSTVLRRTELRLTGPHPTAFATRHLARPIGSDPRRRGRGGLTVGAASAPGKVRGQTEWPLFFLMLGSDGVVRFTSEESMQNLPTDMALLAVFAVAMPAKRPPPRARPSTPSSVDGRAPRRAPLCSRRLPGRRRHQQTQFTLVRQRRRRSSLTMHFERGRSVLSVELQGKRFERRSYGGQACMTLDGITLTYRMGTADIGTTGTSDEPGVRIRGRARHRRRVAPRGERQRNHHVDLRQNEALERGWRSDERRSDERRRVVGEAPCGATRRRATKVACAPVARRS